MKLRSQLAFGIILGTTLFSSCSSSDEKQSEENNVAIEENNDSTTTEEKTEIGTISTKVMIGKEITDVWEIASDLGNLEDYFIGVKNSECTSEEKTGNGATRTCEFMDGGAIDEVVTEWTEGKSFTLRASLKVDTANPMNEGWFYKYVEGTYSLEQVGDNSTEATISMKWEYLDDIEVTDELKERVQGEFTFANNGVAQGLKNFAETGVALTDEDREAFMKQMMESMQGEEAQ